MQGLIQTALKFNFNPSENPPQNVIQDGCKKGGAGRRQNPADTKSGDEESKRNNYFYEYRFGLPKVINEFLGQSTVN